MVKFAPVDPLPEGEPGTLTLRTARRLLNMTRQLEEKVFHANVHVRVSVQFLFSELQDPYIGNFVLFRAGNQQTFLQKRRHRIQALRAERVMIAVATASLTRGINFHVTILTNYWRSSEIVYCSWN